MKISTLIRNKRHPHAGIGIVVELGAPEEEPDYVIAVFHGYGEDIAYADEIEVIDEDG